jgi:DmsE family decaheme c-type cytochrome
VRAFRALDATAVTAACARCHADHPDHAARWSETPWAQEGKSCLTCHVLHGAPRAKFQLPAVEGSIGDIGCAVCHAAVFDATPKTIHAAAMLEPRAGGCESCHGPGAAHAAQASTAPDTLDAQPRILTGAEPDLCTRCHADARERHATRRSSWERPDLDCRTCHQAHGSAAHRDAARALTPPKLPADSATRGATLVGDAACAKCHGASVTGFAATSHGAALAVKSGACESCHGAASLHVTGGNPRAIVRPRTLDRAATTALCGTCHRTDGPDHARDFEGSLHGGAGRTCLSCHVVHSASHGGGALGAEAATAARAAATPVGSAQCATCHAASHPGLRRSVHGTPGAVGAIDCESCHGPGSEHVARRGAKELILQPARMEPKAADALCIACHRDTTSKTTWNRHPHGASGLRCVDCHDPVGDVVTAGVGLRTAEPALCVRCHAAEAAQFRLPRHHRVMEGEMACSDCHDVHRAASPVRAAASLVDGCADCHRAEATPRLHPHRADRHEGCMACHVPHGTTNPAMLRFPTARSLCLSCHGPPAGHDIAPAGVHHDCMQCHTEIHGSDADRTLLR